MTYADGTFTLDGVSIDIPDDFVLTDVQDDEVRWSGGSDNQELRIAKVETSASSSDLTQRKIVDSLNEYYNGCSIYINYKGNSVLTCENHEFYDLLKDPSYKDAQWHNFYTAGSQNGSFIKLSFICKYNATEENLLPQASDEWTEEATSGIVNSLQNDNEVTAMYDIPKEGQPIPSIPTSELSCSYDAYWDDGQYVIDVEIYNPSFLGYEGTVTVTCRDYHDKKMDWMTDHVSCWPGRSWDGYSEQYPRFDSQGSLPIGSYESGKGRFVFSGEKVWTTPAEIEVTIE